MKIFNVSPSEFHENEMVWKEGDLFLFGFSFFSVLLCYLVYSDSSAFLAKIGVTLLYGKLFAHPICSDLKRLSIATGTAEHFSCSLWLFSSSPS